MEKLWVLKVIYTYIVFLQKKKDIFNYKKFFIDPDQEINIKLTLRSQKIICRIDNMNDTEKAKSYTGKLLLIDTYELPKLQKNQFYFHDLTKLNVYVDEKIVGVVNEVRNHGAGDYLEINNEKNELLVPLIKTHVLEINLKKKKILLNPKYYEV